MNVTQSGRRSGTEAGYSLLELLIAMVMILILSTMALSTYAQIKQKVKEASQKEELRGIEKAITGYAIEKGTLPDSLNDLQQGAFLDQWENPVVYVNLQKGGVPRKDVAVNNLNTDFDLYSKGADGATNEMLSHPTSSDDVVRGGNGNFVGMAAIY